MVLGSKFSFLGSSRKHPAQDFLFLFAILFLLLWETLILGKLNLEKFESVLKVLLLKSLVVIICLFSFHIINLAELFAEDF